MAFKIKKKIKKIPFSKLPKFEQAFLETFLEPELPIRIMNVYGRARLSRTVGTLVRFGTGEDRMGAITRATRRGAWVQEYRQPKYEEGFGFVKVGDPFFVRKERFRKHLGEKGAVGIDYMFGM
jgi:hypothetical protein